jgi:hypothetical protein
MRTRRLELDEDDEDVKTKDKYTASSRCRSASSRPGFAITCASTSSTPPRRSRSRSSRLAAKVEEAAASLAAARRSSPITHEYRVADDARDESERTYGSQSWKRADGKEKSKTCEHSVLGVVVAGDGQGETLQVCVAATSASVHFGDVIKQREKNQKLRDSGKGSRRRRTRTDAPWRVLVQNTGVRTARQRGRRVHSLVPRFAQERIRSIHRERQILRSRRQAPRSDPRQAPADPH